MLHYRLRPLNKGPRLFIAALLAIALHLGLMNLEFAAKPITVPGISLPRSMSIVLRRTNPLQSPIKKTESAEKNLPIEDASAPAEKKTPEAVIKKIPAEPEPAAKDAKPPAVLKKPVVRPVETVEMIAEQPDRRAAPPYQAPENTGAEATPREDGSERSQVSPARSEPESTGKGEGVAAPGVLQTAYPRYQLNAPPPYPGLARKRNQQGTVVLQVLVNTKGRVDDLRVDVSSSFSLLDRAALAAVKQWMFEPGRQGNETVPMWVRVPVTFKLKN